MDSFFDQHVFIHTHMEKCGGSTLLHYLTCLLGEKHTCDLRPYPPHSAPALLKNYPELRHKIPKLRLLSGHIRYGSFWEKCLFKKSWPNMMMTAWFFSSYRKNPLYIASIRHPIDRLISLFRYLRNRPEHALYNDFIRDNDFDGFIQQLISINRRAILCLLSRRFCSEKTPAPTFEEAKYIFDHHYFAVAPYDKTHEIADLIADAFEKPRLERKIINPSKAEEKAKPEAKTYLLLEQYCQEEIKFYNYMLKTYPEKLNKARETLHNLISRRTGT